MAAQVDKNPKIPQRKFSYPGLKEEYYEFDSQGDLELLVNVSDESFLRQSGYYKYGGLEEQFHASPESSSSSSKSSTEEDDDDPMDDKTPALPSRPMKDIHGKLVARPKLQLRYRVSSKVMTLASPYFQRMLQGHFQEARDHQSGKLVQVRVEHTETHALEPLLAILHNHKLDTPMTPYFEECLELSLLADMWLCSDAVHFHLSIWFQRLQEMKRIPTPRWCGLECLFFLYVAYRFELPGLFRDVTRVIIEGANGKIVNAAGLQIHHSVFDCMNKRRDEILNDAAQEVYMTWRALKNIRPWGARDQPNEPQRYTDTKRYQFMQDAEEKHFQMTEDSVKYLSGKIGFIKHTGQGSIRSARIDLAHWAKKYDRYFHPYRWVDEMDDDTEVFVSDGFDDQPWNNLPVFEIDEDCGLRLSDVEDAERKTSRRLSGKSADGLQEQPLRDETSFGGGTKD